jgi:hypothetical protein
MPIFIISTIRKWKATRMTLPFPDAVIQAPGLFSINPLWWE